MKSFFVKDDKVHIFWKRINGNFATRMIWCSSNFTNHEVDLKGLADVRTNGGLAISYFLLTYQGDIGYPIFCLKSQVFSSVKKEKID